MLATDNMKLPVIVFLLILIVVLSFQIYIFWGKERKINEEFLELKKKMEAALIEKENLKTELDYLSNPLNLEKELKARFNYRKPEEKMIIIVPPNGSSSQGQ